MRYLRYRATYRTRTFSKEHTWTKLKTQTYVLQPLPKKKCKKTNPKYELLNQKMFLLDSLYLAAWNQPFCLSVSLFLSIISTPSAWSSFVSLNSGPVCWSRWNHVSTSLTRGRGIVNAKELSVKRVGSNHRRTNGQKTNLRTRQP